MKQEAKERKRALGVMERLDKLKQEERALVRNGKKPFFLKASAVKEIALEEKYDIVLTTCYQLCNSTYKEFPLAYRYKELKSSGKLQKYLVKKRRRNASKDRKWLPDDRRDSSN
jgi:ribosomal RNA-processing protein 36